MTAVICAVLSTLLVTSCHRTVLAGRAVSLLYDPARVGGLPAAGGPSGPRGFVPPVTSRLRNTDGGDVDRLALAAINDIEDFWQQHYSGSFPGTFTPVSQLLSYDSNDPASPSVCRNETYQEPNAFYCAPHDIIAWDRGQLLPIAEKYFGAMAINGVLAHEYGHAIQKSAKLAKLWSGSLVREQQADCFTGVYLRWVAEGHSSRFTLSTDDDLSRVLAGGIEERDPISTPEDPVLIGNPHGTAIDRVTAFQKGFNGGVDVCGEIDRNEVKQRRGDLPKSLFRSWSQQTDVPIDNDTLSTLMELLEKIFAPAVPPTLSTDGLANCPTGGQGKPAAYCPVSNVVVVDLPALQQMSTPSDQSRRKDLPQGDNTALSVVTSRYALAVQHQRGLRLDSPMAAMRTACLTGMAQRKMVDPIRVPSGKLLLLAAGDLDEAVTGLLLNGLVASDVNGIKVPAGFTRVYAFHAGLLSDADRCYQRFP
jgi:predicted metalloprotease